MKADLPRGSLLDPCDLAGPGGLAAWGTVWGAVTDEYRVWPASKAVVELEREQWAIFARWKEGYEAGTVGPQSHPGHGGIDTRDDELDLVLAQHHHAPDAPRRLVAELRFDAGARYRIEGLNHWFR